MMNSVSIAARRLAAAGACGMMAFMLLAGAPAQAADDGQESIFGAVVGLFSFDGPRSNEDIAYRERPPLVLPPKMQLRQPLAAAADRNAAWPVDADTARRKKEAEANTLLSYTGFEKVGRKLTGAELQAGRLPAGQAAAPRQPCDDDITKASCTRIKWEDLAGDRIVSPDSNVPLVAGQEPPRRTLTDPPKGYRAPTKVVKKLDVIPVAKEDTSAFSFFKPKRQLDD